MRSQREKKGYYLCFEILRKIHEKQTSIYMTIFTDVKERLSKYLTCPDSGGRNYNP